jgi:hypothetical protein
MMNQEEFNLRLAKAKKDVAKMDQIDGYKERSIGTIHAALECGLKNPDTNAAFDALVMLQDLREMERQPSR